MDGSRAMRFVPFASWLQILLFLFLVFIPSCDSFFILSRSSSERRLQQPTQFYSLNDRYPAADEDSLLSPTTSPSCSRRRWIRLLGGMLPILTSTSAVVAAVDSSQADKSKIYHGYEQLNYLLDHWTEETTICGRSGDNPYISKNGCERTPLKVMDYLGYKDMNHPLFKADKTMRRLEPYVPSDREVDFFNAIENWTIAAEEGNGMAFVSSWGEANPGGGKDRVELFIERAKNNVVQARDSLATIVDILEIQKP